MIIMERCFTFHILHFHIVQMQMVYKWRQTLNLASKIVAFEIKMNFILHFICYQRRLCGLKLLFGSYISFESQVNVQKRMEPEMLFHHSPRSEVNVRSKFRPFEAINSDDLVLKQTYSILLEWVDIQMDFIYSSVKFRHMKFFHFVQLLFIVTYLSVVVSEISNITYHQVNLIV